MTAMRNWSAMAENFWRGWKLPEHTPQTQLWMGRLKDLATWIPKPKDPRVFEGRVRGLLGKFGMNENQVKKILEG
jgi:hypothetical protein